MKLHRVVGTIPQLLFVAALLSACQAVSQPAAPSQPVTEMRGCDGAPKGTCVEVLLRYYEQPQRAIGPYGVSRIRILDPDSKRDLSKSCQICDPKFDSACTTPCPGLQNATLHDASTIILLQSHKSPGCYYLCSGGWCRWICF